jgi:hypothetical protein
MGSRGFARVAREEALIDALKYDHLGRNALALQ